MTLFISIPKLEDPKITLKIKSHPFIARLLLETIKQVYIILSILLTHQNRER